MTRMYPLHQNYLFGLPEALYAEYSLLVWIRVMESAGKAYCYELVQTTYFLLWFDLGLKQKSKKKEPTVIYNGP